MAETEVESILREIRERVLSQQRSGQDRAAASATTNGANGANDSGIAEYHADSVAENLTLLDSYLATTARAWDRLPPVVSNRSGLVARIELWLKRRLRAGTRWFAWEQVNFNAAVHHALRDLLPVLTAHEHELRKLQATIDAKVDAEAEARRVEFEQLPQRTEMNARLAELLSELRERDERLQDQQRVSFKQLSLEASEAAVLEDRARRKTEALLAELQRRIEQIEK